MIIVVNAYSLWFITLFFNCNKYILREEFIHEYNVSSFSNEIIKTQEILINLCRNKEGVDTYIEKLLKALTKTERGLL